MILKKPELLAPAGNWTMLTTAVNVGADSVYFGITELNMRAKAENFILDDLQDIVGFCQSKNVKTHLTVNSIVFEDELDRLDEIISSAKDAGIDMIICWDAAAIQKCREVEIPFCISTQASISNSSAAQFYKNLSAERIVLARECSLEKIIEIKNKVNIQIEAFIHGAMCVAISGRCFMSHHLFESSANRGDCIQPCRREFEIYDRDDNQSLLLGKDYVLSPKDLCTIKFIDTLIEARIDAFKIEGRKRSPEYISTVVSTYRKAIDLYFEGKLTEEIKNSFYGDLGKVYNRGFSNGFYFSTPTDKDFTEQYGSQAFTRKKYIGKVINYFKTPKVVHVKVEADDLKVDDKIYIMGSSTGVVETQISTLLMDDKQIQKAVKGDDVTFLCQKLVRVNDRVYKIIEV